MKYIVTESQYKLLIEYDSNEEGMSSKLRRRLAGLIQHAKDDLEWYVDDEMDPCQYSSVGDFVAEACDFLKDLYIDNIRDFKVSPKDNDALYHYFVDNYGGLLYKIYHKRCAGGDITESQYNLLGESLDKHFRVRDFSPRFVRRLIPMLKTVQNDLDWGVIDNSYPCEFDSVGEFIEESCDMLKDIYIDSIYDMIVDSKDKDELYYYFLHRFSPYLHNVYRQRCVGKNITESKENKLEKHLINYLDSLDYTTEIKINGTRTDVYVPGEEYPIYVAWDEDYVDDVDNVTELRFLSLIPNVYQKLLMMFGLSSDELSEILLKWFNNKFNDSVDVVSNNITVD